MGCWSRASDFASRGSRRVLGYLKSRSVSAIFTGLNSHLDYSSWLLAKPRALNPKP